MFAGAGHLTEALSKAAVTVAPPMEAFPNSCRAGAPR